MPTELVGTGEVVNLKRIERLMRLAGLRGISRRLGLIFILCVLAFRRGIVGEIAAVFRRS